MMKIKKFRYDFIVLCILAAVCLMFPAAVYAAETEGTETLMRFHSVFTNLTPKEEYVLLVMKDAEADEPMHPENLLYMNQETADENGSVAFSYALYAFEQAEVRIYGTGSQDAGELTWSLSDDGVLTIYGSGEMDGFSSSCPAPWQEQGENVRTVIVKDSITKIGAHAFEGCVDMTSILFEGDAPVFEEDCFASLELTVYYPHDNDTWTDAVKQACGGNITWVSDEELSILLQPRDYTGSIGETAVFRIKAVGSNLSYQWQCLSAESGEWNAFDGNGSGTEELKVEVTKERDGMKFRCVVTDGAGKQAASAEASLYVLEEEIPVTGIALDMESVVLTLEEGSNTARLHVIYSPSDANTGKEITWTSSNENVAVVEDGVITATGAGRAVVTALAESGASASCTVIVEKADGQNPPGESEETPPEESEETPPEESEETPPEESEETPPEESEETPPGESGETPPAGSGQAPSAGDSQQNGKPGQGTLLVDSKTNAVYAVMEQGSTVCYKKPVSKKLTKASVPSSVTLEGITYRVTGIAAKAFSGCAKLKTVTIGGNVTTIGASAFLKCKKLTKVVIPAKVVKIEKKAFYGCAQLKMITIKTSKLTRKTVGAKAFKGIHAKAVIKVPKKKKAQYTKLLKARGIGKKVKIKK